MAPLSAPPTALPFRWRAALSQPQALLAAGIVFGLAIRILLLPYQGTLDMRTYLDWGHRTLALGLPSAYSGIYFPVAFQAFGATVRIADVTGLSEVAAVKLVNLVCDAGTLLALLVLLRRWRAPAGYALVYWLNPFFLAAFWLGYVDAQMTVLLLVTLLVLAYGRSPWADLAAGVPLALLVLLKPQGALVGAAIVALAVLALLRRRRDVAPLGAVARMLAAPVLLFAFYSWWIGTSPLHSPLYLVDTIRHTRDFSPSLSANMPNAWELVAELLRTPGEPIYAVAKPDWLHQLATVVTVVLIVAAIAWLVPRIGARPFSQRVLFAVTAVMAIYPMTATAAHENHLFVGGLCLAVVAALLRDRPVTMLLNALLVAQFANLAFLYGLGVNHITRENLSWLLHAYSPGLRALVAALSVVLWMLLGGRLWRTLHRLSPT